MVVVGSGTFWGNNSLGYGASRMVWAGRRSFASVEGLWAAFGE